MPSEARESEAPDSALLFAGCQFSRGVLPETGWFSSTREESAGRRGLYSKVVAPMTWPYVCRSLAAAKREGRKAPSRSLLLMKTSRFLAGLPSFSATEVRGGRLRGRACASEPSDTYAWAVMSVGPGALLYGESVISMLGLAPTNPTRMFVATPRRTRRKLPDSIKVEWLRGIKPTATYNGIPCQSAQDAILSCKGKCCPIDWKLRRRQHASKASSTSSNTTR